MLCCSEQCDRKEQCALFYRNPQPEYRKYDNLESLATHGWGSINFNGCKSYSDCGPLGDYKMFEPLDISTDYKQWKQWLDNWHVNYEEPQWNPGIEELIIGGIYCQAAIQFDKDGNFIGVTAYE